MVVTDNSMRFDHRRYNTGLLICTLATALVGINSSALCAPSCSHAAFDTGMRRPSAQQTDSGIGSVSGQKDHALDASSTFQGHSINRLVSTVLFRLSLSPDESNEPECQHGTAETEWPTPLFKEWALYICYQSTSFSPMTQATSPMMSRIRISEMASSPLSMP